MTSSKTYIVNEQATETLADNIQTGNMLLTIGVGGRAKLPIDSNSFRTKSSKTQLMGN